MKFFSKLYTAIIIVTLITPISLFAYVMQSTSYRIDSDSINVGGLDVSTSTNYGLSDTVGEVATGLSSSTNYQMSGGYRIVVGSSTPTYITISSASDVALSSISGLAGGVATGSSSWIVTTNSSAGYQLTVVASTTPALKAAQSSISDYVPVGADPDYSFSVSSSAAAFGFSPEGADIVGRYKDNGASCNFGTNDTTDKCWDGLSTTPRVISSGASPNTPSGATTTIKYRVEIGATKIQDAADGYSATITVTAITL